MWTDTGSYVCYIYFITGKLGDYLFI